MSEKITGLVQFVRVRWVPDFKIYDKEPGSILDSQVKYSG